MIKLTEEQKEAGRATKDREVMEQLLDYEIRGSWFYGCFYVLELCGFLPLMGQWFGWKVKTKYARGQQHSSVMQEIVDSREP